MLQGIKGLAADEATKVIVLISKPPAADVAKQVLERAHAAPKPVVVCFFGVDPKTVEGGKLTAARTLEDGAYFAAALAKAQRPTREPSKPLAKRPKFKLGQKYICGLYSGGTFCFEASLLLSDAFSPV